MTSQRSGMRSLGLRPTLLVSIGLLVLLSVGSVLALNWLVGRGIVQNFATRLIARVIYIQELALRQQLDAVAEEARFVVAAVKEERYRISDAVLGDFLAGSTAATPYVGITLLADPEGRAWRITRGELTRFQADRIDINREPVLQKAAEEIRSHRVAHWGPPVFRAADATTYLNYRIPIWREDVYLGFYSIAVSTQAISSLARKLSDEDPAGASIFVLYDEEHVLAHPRSSRGDRSPSEAQLVPLRSFGDPVLADLSRLPRLTDGGIRPPPGTLARVSIVDGERFFVFTRRIGGYAGLPLTVGIYVSAHAVDAPLRYLYLATLAALTLFGLALLAAGLVASVIARPIRRVAQGASAIGTLDFDVVEPLPSSRITEIGELATSFNAMLDGLKAFGRYVPKSLVARLIKEKRVGAGIEERELAIMFTDVVGFTPTCATLSAAEVAAFVNHHLSLVATCVEREGGTIDKFIGDAVMAFWGAPEVAEDSAASACRAALAIQLSLEADNQRRKAAGQMPVRIRIGVHLGRVVVGDIGSPSRINYTIVGDAVNATQRLEALGKVVDPDAVSIILISDETRRKLPADFATESCGVHQLRGREGASFEVFRLGTGITTGAQHEPSIR